MPKKRGKVAPVKVMEPVEIQPGEAVDIRLGRLESGEWYSSIGQADGEDSIVSRSAFPWQALSGIGKQIRGRTEALIEHKILGPECGRCENVTLDGRLCGALECPVGGALAVAQALRASHPEGEPTQFAPEREIVRLYGKLEKPRLVGAEEADELTATVKVTGEDLGPEYGYLREEATNEVVVIFYRSLTAPKATDVPLGQRNLDFEPDGNAQPEHGEALMCPVCEKEIHAEGQEPGMTCPLCENGVLEIVKRSAEGNANPEARNDEPAEGEAD